MKAEVDGVRRGLKMRSSVYSFSVSVLFSCSRGLDVFSGPYLWRACVLYMSTILLRCASSSTTVEAGWDRIAAAYDTIAYCNAT